MTKTTQLHISRFDPELKARLIEEAEKEGVSINDYAVSVFAARFGIKFARGDRRGPGASVTNGALMLPVPVPLYNRIHQAVLKQPKGKKSLIWVADDTFREHFAKLDAETPAAV